MTRRKPSAPDTRLNWRDPEMPILGKSGRPIPHEKMTTKSKMQIELSPEPSWRNDPTYNLRRRK